jgi:hypothetical protein
MYIQKEQALHGTFGTKKRMRKLADGACQQDLKFRRGAVAKQNDGNR